jgi:hypothetical protein
MIYLGTRKNILRNHGIPRNPGFKKPAVYLGTGLLYVRGERECPRSYLEVLRKITNN